MDFPGKPVAGHRPGRLQEGRREINMKGNRARAYYTDAYMNDEGYSDPTAGIAIERLYREQMRKKRAEETRILMERSGKTTIQRNMGHDHGE